MGAEDALLSCTGLPAGLPACLLTRRWRYLRTYFLTDVIACLPFNCVCVAANDSLNYYNLGDLLKCVAATRLLAI